jgi:hypothetical protein
LYGADAQGNFYTLALDSSGVTIVQQVSSLLGGDGYSVYSGGLVYDAFGAVVDPSIPSVTGTYDNVGPIVPLPDLQEVLILGEPALSLNNAEGGSRLWSLPLPIQNLTSQTPVIRLGENGVATRESEGGTANLAPGIDLFVVNLSQ